MFAVEGKEATSSLETGSVAGRMQGRAGRSRDSPSIFTQRGAWGQHPRWRGSFKPCFAKKNLGG